MQNRLLRAGRCLREKKLDEAMSADPNSIRILAVDTATGTNQSLT